MTIASFTDSTKSYDVTVRHGQAVDCTCGDRHFRRHECKHMSNAQVQINAEIAKAERFLALKRQIETQEREARENRACYLRMMASAY
jgi:hypothetical protein